MPPNRNTGWKLSFILINKKIGGAYRDRLLLKYNSRIHIGNEFILLIVNIHHFYHQIYAHSDNISLVSLRIFPL
ncbi:Uncharacterised protein [Streptococcus pneumoniae]|nr:Uncharacterised protein [Streptococcus pneumoniae]CJO31498.1 Uncharacterised protein [Streptococcus pneumoniae]CJU52621.1 Uncharacterised protein [Streptococcus pneumoniae]COS64093.1 Uncharacterised protein [Streptococcus pneumoniae]COS68635.1 Uncharacterised protein [Streptococcus pneumoniae]